MNAFKKGLVATAAVFAIAAPLAAMTPAVAAPASETSASISTDALASKTKWVGKDYQKNRKAAEKLRDHLRDVGFQADILEKGAAVYLSFDKSNEDAVRAVLQYQPALEGKKSVSEPKFEKYPLF